MRLFYSPVSPYTRKVRAVLEYFAISDIAMVPVDPFKNPPELVAVNPLSKIPTLVTEEGDVLSGSALIVDYLDNLFADDERSLYPMDERQGWLCCHLAGLAEGIIDAALSCVLERRRPEEKQWPQVLKLQQEKIGHTLQHLPTRPWKLAVDAPTVYEITLGCALGYLDFRLPDMDWRADNAFLATWYEDFARHDFMVKTRPAR